VKKNAHAAGFEKILQQNFFSSSVLARLFGNSRVINVNGGIPTHVNGRSLWALRSKMKGGIHRA
jgi:hypothetical protein